MTKIEKIDVASRIAKRNLELLAELEAARKDISTLLGIANENMREADKLRAALEEVMPFVEFQLHKMMEESNTIPITRALGLARAALGGDND